MSKRNWEDIEPPPEEGYYWVQWWNPDGSCDGLAEIQWVDRELPGWTANRSAYSWLVPEQEIYPRKNGVDGTGAGRWGEKTPKASNKRLTDEEVRAIRKLHHVMTAKAVGCLYGVTHYHVYDIWKGASRRSA